MASSAQEAQRCGCFSRSGAACPGCLGAGRAQGAGRGRRPAAAGRPPSNQRSGSETRCAQQVPAAGRGYRRVRCPAIGHRGPAGRVCAAGRRILGREDPLRGRSGRPAGGGWCIRPGQPRSPRWRRRHRGRWSGWMSCSATWTARTVDRRRGARAAERPALSARYGRTGTTPTPPCRTPDPPWTRPQSSASTRIQPRRTGPGPRCRGR